MPGAYAVSDEWTSNAICEILGRRRGRDLVVSVMPSAEGKATEEVQFVFIFAIEY